MGSEYDLGVAGSGLVRVQKWVMWDRVMGIESREQGRIDIWSIRRSCSRIYI